MDENEKKQAAEATKSTMEKGKEAIEKLKKVKNIKITMSIMVAKAVAVLALVFGLFGAVVFFAGALKEIGLDEYKKANNAKDNAFGELALGKIITLDEGNYKIEYNGKKGTEAIYKILEENGMNFENFTDEEIDCLYNCLKAEWATTYPNLGQTVEENSDEYIQGVITIKRGKQDGTVIDLTYKPYEEFTNIKDETALNHFSIKDGNLIVANWSSSQVIYEPSESMPENIKSQYVNTGEQISITETSIDYKSIIGIHTMPFEFLLALLVNTEDVDFVNELADLAYNSTLGITVYDNVIETITVETEHIYEKTTYKKWIDYKTYTTTQNYDKDGNPIGQKTTFGAKETHKLDSKDYNETDYTLTTKIINKSNSYALGLTNVSSWLADIKDEYTYVTNIGEEIDLGLGEPYEYTQELPVEDISTSDSEVVEFKNTKISGPTTVTNEDETTTSTYNGCSILAARRQGTLKGKQEITKNTNQQNEYKYESSNKQTSNIGTKFKEVYDNNKKAQAQFDCVSSWLFELLEETESGVDYVSVMKYLLYICTGEDYGISEEEINGLLEYSSTISYQSAGNLSAFGCTITKESFIESAKNYKKDNSTYQSKMAAYAEDFYDVCTKYNVNPVIAYAHSCLETGYGNSIPYNNYFGMGVYNGASSGSTYSSPKESIEDYCKWIVNNATIGTPAYAENVKRAEEWGKENEKLLGTPDNNIYALYCHYAFLGEKHFCDEPDFNNPKGTEYYLNNGSSWGDGGRVYIYEMYEKGGLYTGQYKTLCGHKNANDPTTIKEKADYVEYTTNKRISIAKDIFGAEILSANGNILSSNVSGEILQVAEDTFNVIVKQGKKPYDQYSYHKIQWPYTSSSIDCSAYLGVVLYRLGYTEFEGDQKNSNWWYNESDTTIKKYGWQSFYITGKSDINKLQPGDILAYNGSITGNYSGHNNFSGSRNHVQIVDHVDVKNNKVIAWDCGSYPVTQRLGPDTQGNIWFWGYHSSSGKGVKVIRIIDSVESE